MSVTYALVAGGVKFEVHGPKGFEVQDDWLDLKPVVGRVVVRGVRLFALAQLIGKLCVVVELRLRLRAHVFGNSAPVSEADGVRAECLCAPAGPVLCSASCCGVRRRANRNPMSGISGVWVFGFKKVCFPLKMKIGVQKQRFCVHQKTNPRP